MTALRGGHLSFEVVSRLNQLLLKVDFYDLCDDGYRRW